MYIPHNDYELLYLYKEGNERALDILFYKYEHLIETVVNDYMPYGDSRPDMVQEGRIILFNCIKSFNEYIGVTFYSYFVIALRRKLYKLAKDNYYSVKNFRFNEEIDYFNLYGSPNDNHPLTKLIITSANHEYSNDELALDIFNECILSGMTIADFSKKYNVMYHVVYYKYRQIIDNIKKILA